jgi:uncharacterized protein
MKQQKPIKQPTFWEKSVLRMHGYYDVYNMAECYRNGKYVKKDLAIAELLYKQAIHEGNKEVYFHLGELYEEKSKAIVTKYGQKALYQQALKNYFNSALLGNAKAKTKLEQGAEDGNAIAYYYLGVVYEREQKIEIAVDYYRMAAIDEEVLTYAMDALSRMSSFNPKAASCLAKMYEQHELGILRNPERTMEYYEKAHVLKDKDAGLRLGQLYQVDHDGIARDASKTWAFYVQAAQNGNQEAIVPLERLGEDAEAKKQRQLGDLYKLSFFKSPAKVVYWYDKAKETEDLLSVSETEAKMEGITYL